MGIIPLHIVGMMLVLALIVGVGVLSGRRVKGAGDFITSGGKSGSLLVCGTIMGSLVASQATIGTAQLAFTYGLSAWWFTLGAGIGCLILAVGYALPLRRSGKVTLLQIIAGEYGHRAEVCGSVLCSIGILVSVLAQVVACVGLLTLLFPVSDLGAALISVALMTVYVVFGGAWGAGMGGVVKLVLLYLSCVAGLGIVLAVAGGPGGLLGGVRDALLGSGLGAQYAVGSEGELAARYLSLTARGATKDLGSGLSLCLGVLATQTYAQAIWSGKSDAAARRGALLSAALIPPLGIAGIAIGLFMRGQCVTVAELQALMATGQALPEGMGVIASTIQVFPAFVMAHLPDLLAGVVLGTLLISVVGGGAGLSLGMATILVSDIYQAVSQKCRQPKVQLLATRLTIVAVLVVAAAVACTVPSATINDFGFLSMGLRAAVVFAPVTGALFLPARINSRCALAAIIAGPLCVLAGEFLLPIAFDPLFLGVLASTGFVVLGLMVGRKRPVAS